VSLHPHAVDPIPADTARIARAAFRRGNAYMHMRDELGALFADEMFTPLFPTRGQPAESPWRLALVTIMQYAEGLPDRQAADAVRGRIDWKYSLSLDLADPRFDASVLSEFRTRLVAGGLEERLLDTMLERFRERKLLKERGRQRTDSTRVLGAIRTLNRLECAGETLCHALNSLAIVAPDWLRIAAQPDWVRRYGPRVDSYHFPAGKEERLALAETMARDGDALLAAVYARGAPAWLRTVPAVDTLRRVWVQQFYHADDTVRWRTDQDGLPPSATMIGSPYDVDAHYGKKGETSWVGYKVHLTETCDDEGPNLITHVETTAAPISDGATTTPIHRALERKNLLPRLHIVDTGYTDAALIVESRRDFDVDLLGPARPDNHWQKARDTRFDARHFHVDWVGETATCPEGRRSSSWTPAIDNRKNEVIKVKFSRTDCVPCPSRDMCTLNKSLRRAITIRREAAYLALEAARERQETDAFKEEYARRAGVEGTMSQGVRAFGMRRARYIGGAKTHLQHVLTAAAMNFVRVAHWLDDKPLARTRPSAFVALMAPAA
jgi:transposase